MNLLLLIFGLFVSCCSAGLVEKTSYEPRYDYNLYIFHDLGKYVIKNTPHRNQFLLGIECRRNIEYSTGLFSGGQIDDENYQNRVQVYYNNFLLDNLKVPSIDKLKPCSLSLINQQIMRSVHPQVPQPDSAEPGYIVVYYSLTDNTCVKSVYSENSIDGRYYTKDVYDVEVNWQYCR